MLFVKNIKINNFRCFDSKKIDFKPNINILIGSNGCGKTSIVEGISYLCLGKSFKNAKDSEVLKFGKEYFNVICDIQDQNDKKVVISFDGNHKKVKDGDTICQTLSEYVGKYKLISFSPDDLDIIKGSPSIRRRFLDMFIGQIDNNYLKVLVEYKKTLKMRNEFLKKIDNGSFDSIMFEVLNEKLISTGKIIIEKRNKYIDILNRYIKDISKQLSNGKEIVNIQYNPNVILENFEKSIESHKKLDILSKQTNIGPQKDDLNIYLNEELASIYGSQGQIRLSVLSMKLGVFEVFKEIDQNIIIILDDVFSELDNERQVFLLEYIKNTGQVFITCTDINKMPEELKESSNIINIEEGE